ncbi:hypothetical protein L1887_16391 [Cichorium endivia]|nr:hypothetical protein L1887_16391 [Cichorium endivia]
MHVARGGWLGQTYALAKFDDSFEGKKSGIRRSKEERKGMVETFIKRYQKSNNGDFPSLNLTRKEVGGSFYTVREIVREIIQENRVLGPPKSPPGDRNMENLDSFLEHNPLGSMSVDHHVHVVPPNDTQTQKHHIVEDLAERAASLGSLSSASHTMDEKSNEREAHDGDLEEKDIENGEVAADVADVQLEEEITHSVPQSKPTFASHKNQNDSSSEENIVLDADVSTDLKLEDSLPAVEKTINGVKTQNLVDKKSSNLNKSSDPPSSISQKRRTTLNRINLESWEAASKKSNRPETHRLVTFIKSFVTAFVKFWTE